MPTDDCHIQYRDHLDDMQMGCAPGRILRVWKVTMAGERGSYSACVVAADCGKAEQQAREYLRAQGTPQDIVGVREIGHLLRSGR